MKYACVLLYFLGSSVKQQGNTSVSWQLSKTAKETHHFLGSSAKQPRKGTVSLAADENSQENIFFGCSLLPPRKHYIFWQFYFGRQANFWPPR